MSVGVSNLLSSFRLRLHCSYCSPQLIPLKLYFFEVVIMTIINVAEVCFQFMVINYVFKNYNLYMIYSFLDLTVRPIWSVRLGCCEHFVSYQGK